MSEKELTGFIRELEKKQLLSEETAFQKLEQVMQTITSVYLKLLGDILKIRETGIDISEEVILQQLKNMEQALKKKDVVLLHDTIKYEVLGALYLYQNFLMKQAG